MQHPSKYVIVVVAIAAAMMDEIDRYVVDGIRRETSIHQMMAVIDNYSAYKHDSVEHNHHSIS